MSVLARWRWLVAALILIGLGWQFAQHAGADWTPLRAPAIAPLLVATALGTASYVALANAWARLRGAGESWIDVGGAWFASLLARYAPGGIWQATVRVVRGHAAGERARDAVARYVSEQSLACFSAAVAALTLAALPPTLEPALAAALAAVALATVAISALLMRLGAGVRWPWRAVGWTLAGHVLMAAGFAALVFGWIPLTIETVVVAARGFLIAGLAGLLAVFVPAGLGVREGVLTWLLAPYVGVPAALALALVARIWLFACELAAWALWALAFRRLRADR